MSNAGPRSLGKNLALVVGAVALAGGLYVALVGHGTALGTILVLVGASALSGWVRARRAR